MINLPNPPTPAIKIMEKNVDYYMSLPYSMIVQPIHDESGDYYHGRVLELTDVRAPEIPLKRCMKG